MKSIGPGSNFLFAGLTGGLIGLVIGFVLCYISFLSPYQKQVKAREEAVQQWDDINRRNVQRIGELQDIGIIQIQKWIAETQSQSNRFAEMQRLLNKQQQAMTRIPLTPLVIAVVIVVCIVVGIIVLSNIEKSKDTTTLQNALVLLPPLIRESITSSSKTSISSQIVNSQQLQYSQEKIQTQKRYEGNVVIIENDIYGFIETSDFPQKVHFNVKDVSSIDRKKLTKGIRLAFTIAKNIDPKTGKERLHAENITVIETTS
jgi:hypothetical protein